ncbi:MAG: hypothetical protein Q8O67_18830 [Deltaproteobacteria bacterium]|nr:hypothetical protein [Deltaproteobacteria bacterium]
MNVVRINRMMLGVAAPVAAFCNSVFGTALLDVESPAESVGCDVLIVGRQQLTDTGIYRFAHDVIPRCLALHRPQLLVPVIADRYEPHRYARDFEAWQAARMLGVAVVVFEFGIWREHKSELGAVEAFVGIARAANVAAKTSSSPLSWLSGSVLTVDGL